MEDLKKSHHPGFTVIKDTREQDGYNFEQVSPCLGMVELALPTGDYTIAGLEDILCIERKGCVEELAMNIGKKRGAFLAEIDRMQPIKHKYLLLEFSMGEVLKFPKQTRIPQELRKQTNITGKYIMKFLTELTIYHDIHVIFCGDKFAAFMMINSIFKRINEKYNMPRIS